VKAVLLAAGEGQRLEPLTVTCPKHLIKVAGKPILQFCLDAIKTAGITDVAIVTHYMSDTIRAYFGNGDSQGLKISYIEQKELLGTGNAAMTAEQYTGEEPFVLVYGDLLFAQTAVKQAVDLYENTKPKAVIAAVAVDKPENYGIIEFAEGKKLRRIIEKPEAEKAPSNLANAGIYEF
jgi:bifunctional UDP-N-acetylglucosamine pyrophosphorylase/glucosamine-1-phosphate N-acetyltransferase